MSTQEEIQRLEAGNERFVQYKLDRKLQDRSRMDELVSGQSPYAIFLSCADHRVVPELAFDAGLGELFVVRIAGNMANNPSISSIEYAVAYLNSNVIVVLRHQDCGAITTAMSGGDKGYNLNHLLPHIDPALNAIVQEASLNEVVKKNAELTGEELVNRSAIIFEAVAKGN